MNVKSIKSSVIAVMSAAAGVIVSTTAFAVERPELRAYPFKTSVTEGGTYANGSTVGTDFVVSGTISFALTFSSDVPYRVTLDGAAVSETITLAGDATLWLVGDNVIETTAATATGSGIDFRSGFSRIPLRCVENTDRGSLTCGRGCGIISVVVNPHRSI